MNKDTFGMKAPVEDFDVDEAAREYEKATRTSDIFCEENLDVVPVAKVREALGIAEDSDIFQCIKYRNHQLETLRTELAAARRKHHNSVLTNSKYSKLLVDIRHAAGMADDDYSNLVEYIKTLREANEELANHRVAEGWLRKDNSNLAIKVADLKEQIRVLRYDILEVYHEIFDCSNGDPEGTDEETMQDILTEYKRVLKLKDAAEEKTIKYKELARENEEKAKNYKIRLGNAERQLRWTEEVCSERLKQCEDLTREREKVKRMEQKLIEIQDICER